MIKFRFKTRDTLSFSRLLPDDNGDAQLNEQEIALQKWWLYPYYRNGKTRLMYTYEYCDGRLLLDRSSLLYIKFDKIEKKV